MSLLGSWIKRLYHEKKTIWKTLVDKKYLSNSPNIFAASPTAPLQFWKGVMWASKAIKTGYRWCVGDGARIRTWEDTWFGSSPLAVQFWPLYEICHQQAVTLDKVVENGVVKLTFRRVFTPTMMESWLELEQILLSVRFSDSRDSLIWQHESKRGLLHEFSL